MILKSRQKTFQVLNRFRLSFSPTLSEEAYVVAVLSNEESESKEAGGDDSAAGPVTEEIKVDTKMSVIESIKAERAAMKALAEAKQEKKEASRYPKSMKNIEYYLLFCFLSPQLWQTLF